MSDPIDISREAVEEHIDYAYRHLDRPDNG
jgi:hypothetical protein